MSGLMDNFYRQVARKRDAILLTISVLFLSALVLSPMLDSGYLSDDYINSMINGILKENHVGLISFTVSQNLGWIYGGRIFPLSTYVNIFFHFVTSLVLYKAILLAAVLINMVAFGYLVKKLSGSDTLGIISMLLVPALVQFRLQQDPVLSYVLLLQLVLFYATISIIALVVFLERNKSVYLLISIFFYLVGYLTYEITYPLIVIHLLVIYFYGHKKNIVELLKVSSPFIFLSVFCLLLPVTLRLYLKVPLSGDSSSYVPSLNVYHYLATLAMQTSAAFPLSYYANNQDFFNRGLDMGTSFIMIAVTIFAGFFIVSMALFRRIQSDPAIARLDRANIKGLIIIGLLFLVLPGVLISSSPKYQGFESWLSWGSGYLPVYVSYFGMALLIASLICLAFKKYLSKNKNYVLIASAIVALLLSGIATINYVDNYKVVEQTSLYSNYPRAIIQDAIGNGLFNGLPDGATLVRDEANAWDIRAFYLAYSDKDVTFVGTPGTDSFDVQDYGAGSYPQDALVSKDGDGRTYSFTEDDNVYFLSYHSSAYKDGYALLSDVKDVTLSDHKIYNLTSTRLYLYVSGPSLSYTTYKSSYISISGVLTGENGTAVRPFRFDEANMTLISSGSDWKLFSVSGNGMLFDMQSISVDKA